MTHAADAFWELVDQSGGPDACWPWTRPPMDTGYGQLSWKAFERLAGHQLAHRVAYFLAYGEIPKEPGDLTVDHECHNRDLSCPGGACSHRLCCNPRHLVLASRGENRIKANVGRAKGQDALCCPRGHAYDEQNTRWVKGRSGSTTSRQCKACAATRKRQIDARKKALRDGYGFCDLPDSRRRPA